MKDEQSSLTEPAAAGTSWTVGGDTSLQAVLEHRECPSLIADALTGVLSWQVRVETHVRRAIASPRLAPQLVAALLALGCEVTLKGADGPERAELAALVETPARNDTIPMKHAARVLASHHFEHIVDARQCRNGTLGVETNGVVELPSPGPGSPGHMNSTPTMHPAVLVCSAAP